MFLNVFDGCLLLGFVFFGVWLFGWLAIFFAMSFQRWDLQRQGSDSVSCCWPCSSWSCWMEPQLAAVGYIRLSQEKRWGNEGLSTEEWGSRANKRGFNQQNMDFSRLKPQTWGDAWPTNRKRNLTICVDIWSGTLQALQENMHMSCCKSDAVSKKHCKKPRV